LTFVESLSRIAAFEFCGLDDMTQSRLSSCGGSLILCLLTRNSIYVSADSRYANAPEEIRDSAEKLLAFGSSAVCALSGQLRFTRFEYGLRPDPLNGVRSFELADIVRGLDDCGPPADGRGAVRHFADSLYAGLQPVWESFASDLNEPFGLHLDRPLPLAELMYVDRLRDGRPVLSSIILKHSLHYTEARRYCSVLHSPIVTCRHEGQIERPVVYLQGMKFCARPGNDLNIPDDAAARTTINNIFNDARRKSRCRAAIGGPIDLAVIDENGRRWLQHKTYLSRQV
jgi:hypothetical protein